MPGPTLRDPGGRKAILFDLDGTLIDSAPDIAGAINALLAELGRPPLALEAVKAMTGDGGPILVERAVRAAGAGQATHAMVERFRTLYDSRLTSLTEPYPLVKQTLDQIATAQWLLGVCTNKRQDQSERILEALGLASWFDAVLGGDKAPAQKPDGRHALALLETLGVPPGDAVLVGDSRNDVACARNAGLRCIVVGFGYSAVPAADLGADLVVERFDALPAALARLDGPSFPLKFKGN